MATANAQPANLVSQTAKSTKLGYVLQGVIEQVLRDSGATTLEITANAEYQSGVIKPDIVLGDLENPAFSIHVTCSDSRDSFRMKRWRYVCELFQLKNHCRSVVAINAVFGDSTLYQPGDLAFLARLFDRTVNFGTSEVGTRVFEAAMSKVEAGCMARAAVASIVESLSRREKQSLISPISSILSASDRSVADVWRLNVERRRGRSMVVGAVESESRGAFLRCLLLTALEFKELCQFVAGRIGAPPRAAINAGLVRLDEDIAGDNYELAKGVREVCSDTLLSLRRIVLCDPNLERLILEARGDETAMNWAATAHSELIRRPSVAGVSRLMELCPSHPRELVVDAMVAMFSCSVNSMEGLWDHANFPVGVKNPLANIVSKTALVKLSRAAKVHALKSVWEGLQERHGGQSIAVDAFVQALVKYRKYCLLKGSIVNPLDLMTADLIESLGYESLGKKRFTSSLVSGSPLATEFSHSFRNPATRRRFAVKNLYGDTGADHKAEEMAGRLFLLDFQISDESAKVYLESRDWDFVFIPEGYWSAEQLNVLISAGWRVAASGNLMQCMNEFVGPPVEPNGPQSSRRGRQRSAECLVARPSCRRAVKA